MFNNMEFLKQIFIIVTCLNITCSASANHIIGADITYKNTGINKYEITIKMYRDCSGVPISSPSSNIICAATKSQITTFTPSEIAVRDITPTCGRAGKPCNPLNTTSDKGIEEHTYSYTYDFTAAIKTGCCQVLIGTGGCCRSDNITTGASGQKIWVSAFLNLCLSKPNNSPIFYDVPKAMFNCNQPVYFNIEAHDSIYNDSLVYEMVDPMQDWTQKTTWIGDKSKNMPLSVYCIGPCIPAIPQNKPPQGFYLDSSTGDVIFTPTNCNESSIISTKISEYRKYPNGEYVIAGYVSRDYEARVAMMINIPTKPIITVSGNTLYSNYKSGNQWYQGIYKIIGATTHYYTPSKTRAYSVNHTDSNGCITSMSDPFNFLASNSKIKTFVLKIYPNPVSECLKIECSEFGKFQLHLFDFTGKLIKEESFIGNHYEWLLHLNKGVYNLKISNEKGEIESVVVNYI